MKLAETKVKINQYSFFLYVMVIPSWCGAKHGWCPVSLWKICNIGKGVVSHKCF